MRDNLLIYFLFLWEEVSASLKLERDQTIFLPVGSLPEAEQFLKRMSINLRPILVDWSPIFTSTASIFGECMPQYGDISRAAQVCKRLAVGAAALAIIPSKSLMWVRQWCNSLNHPMLEKTEAQLKQIPYWLQHKK